MKPDLELVQIAEGESFKAWEHGYPYHTVRWHFHPEFELHQVHATSGRYFVGDFIGHFQPGNLVLVGPNLPHNWVSDLPEGTTVPLRSRVMQFSQPVVDGLIGAFPETGDARDLFARSRAGVVFSAAAEHAVAPLFAAVVGARGVARIALFLQIIAALASDAGAQTLTTPAYLPDPSGYMSHGLNAVLAHINANLTEVLSEVELAAIADMTPATLSRNFRRHTGQPLTKYVNRLRVNLASQLLMAPDFVSVADVCFGSGFNNLSNFNRQFLAQRGMTPSEFRRHLTGNKSFGEAA
jgi:AraC-like DNA-binding protein